MNDADGFRLEAAEQFGFEEIDGQDAPGQEGYFCTEAELIAFAKACERKGMADARALAEKVTQRATLGPMTLNYRLGWSAGGHAIDMALLTRITEIDAELKPIWTDVEVRFMTTQGYVRDEAGKHWVKP